MSNTLLIETAFYSSAVLLAYIYFLYPLVLMILSPGNRDKSLAAAPFERTGNWPFVSVIVAAFNEEKVIEARIRNFLDTDYAGRSEIIVVSDASTDSTGELVRKHTSTRVRLFVQERRQGKGAAINRAVPEARGDILVFTDATSIFVPETLTELVSPFCDSNVGLVNGRIHYEGAEIANLYHRYEQLLKSVEIRSGIVASAHGAIYAMRKRLWERHDPRLVNDFFDPIITNLKGMFVAIAPGALCIEEFSTDTQFKRQVRMVALAALVFFKIFPRLIRERRWLLLLVLTSHKFLRWLTAVWLVLLVMTTLWLAPSGSIFSLALELEMLIIAFTAIGFIATWMGLSERLAFSYKFLVLNLAAAVGLWVCLSGRVTATWQPNAN